MHSKGSLKAIGCVPATQPAADRSLRRDRGLMAQRPNVGGNRRQLVGSELSSTHGRHWAAIFLGIRHSFFDRFQNSSVAAIAPQPLSGGEIRTQWRTCSVPAVTTCTRSAAYLAVIDAIAQGNHRRGRSFGN